ncbi:hypothetical protein GGS26DRAFT_570250 [Hypomontagnella submonticulosa]|nr:hypothetical protein GGS26DRAFT_570250 [Hypomontagnella submonticulosa]
MSGKAPSEGTKVTAGKNAPTTTEGPGLVAEDSLAAESQSFRQANQAVPQQVPHESLTSASKPHQGGIHQSTTASATTTSGQGDGNAAAAPSYVQSQYFKDRAGPHGKNLKEDDSIGTEDKSKNASFSQFGTKDDPGRAAEEKFTLSDTANAGSTGGRDKNVDAKQPYDALGGDTEA